MRYSSTIATFNDPVMLSGYANPPRSRTGADRVESPNDSDDEGHGFSSYWEETGPPGDWLVALLRDRGYLAKLKGDSIKVYLALLEKCGGRHDNPVTVSTGDLAERARLSPPTVSDALQRLQALGLVEDHGRPPGGVKTYSLKVPNEQ